MDKKDINLESVARTWVKIDEKALKNNFNSLSKYIQNNKNESVYRMAVVKSNAYGHGIIECAQIFSDAGADFLAVDCIEEAIQIRDAEIQTPILVLGFTPKENFLTAIEKNISLTISSLKSLKDAVAFSKNIKSDFLRIHIKADTGLHRQGFLESERKTVLNVLEKAENICTEGLYSHLAGAESKKFKKYTEKQTMDFIDWIEEFWKAGFNPITHIGASAAGLIYPETYFDMIRFGISLYGLWPDSQEVKKSEIAKESKIKLSPALTWESIVTDIKKISKGESVGYDCSEKLRKNSMVAVVPIGYWHGLPRHASKVAEVLINGKTAKVLGKVSMDMIVVDVTNIKVKHGDIVTIIGKNKNKVASAESLAEKCGTINYEIVTRINPEIPRIYE